MERGTQKPLAQVLSRQQIKAALCFDTTVLCLQSPASLPGWERCPWCLPQLALPAPSPALARVRLLWAHLCSPRAGRSLPCSGGFHLGLWGSLGRRPSLKLAAVLPHHSTGPVPGQPVDMGMDLTSPTWGLHLGQRPHTVVCCGQDGVRQHGRVLRAVATTPVVSPHAALAFEKCFDHTPSNPSGGPCSWLYVLTSSLPPLCSRPLHSNPASTGGAALGRLAMGVGSVHWAGKDRHRALPFRNEGRHAEQLLATSHIGLYPP